MDLLAWIRTSSRRRRRGIDEKEKVEVYGDDDGVGDDRGDGDSDHDGDYWILLRGPLGSSNSNGKICKL